MADTTRLMAAILAQFPDNASGLISPQMLRDFVVSAMPTGRGGTKIVAAANASDLWKAQADVVCTGANDDAQIRAAIDALPADAGGSGSGGGTVILSDGKFVMGSSGLVLNACTRKGGYRIVGQGGLTNPYPQNAGMCGTLIYGPDGVPVITIGSGSLYSADMIDLENFGVMSAGTGAGSIGVLAQGVRNITMRRVGVYQSRVGIRLTKAEWMHLSDVVTQNVLQYGLDVIVDSYADGHFHAESCEFQMPSTILAGGSAVHLIGGSVQPNPWYEALFSRCQFYISPGAAAAGCRCFHQEGRFGSIHQATRNLTFLECQFEDEGSSITNIGVDLETCNHINFIGPSFASGGAMKFGIRTANDPGCYVMLNSYFNTAAPAGGYHIYNNVGDFYLLGYKWDNLTNHFLTPATVHHLLATQLKATGGAPTDGIFGDAIFPMDGMMVVNTNEHRLYVRDGGVWKYAGLT